MRGCYLLPLLPVIGIKARSPANFFNSPALTIPSLSPRTHTRNHPLRIHTHTVIRVTRATTHATRTVIRSSG